ncbi:MAG: hypothetical protein AAB214_21260 [Fibrobacterota bacterium]
METDVAVMDRKWVFGALLAACAAIPAKDPGTVGFRFGLRGSETDFALFAGPSLHAKGLVVSEDFWINPYRQTELAQIRAHYWNQVKQLRYGFVTGVRYQLGGDQLSILPGVGIENILGSYYGTTASPEWSMQEWVGLEIGFLKYHRIGARLTTGEQKDHSRLRIEWTIQCR